jgi:hypothetical protein
MSHHVNLPLAPPLVETAPKMGRPCDTPAPKGKICASPGPQHGGSRKSTVSARRGSSHRPAFALGLRVLARVVLCALFTTVLALAGCGSDSRPMSEDYGNLLASPGGLVVLQEEHPSGWTRPDCFACHNVNNIHQVNRTGLPNNVADLAGVRAIVNNQGLASCALCHGDNGVQ